MSEDWSLGSSVYTTEKKPGQNAPAIGIDYDPTYAVGEELKGRKRVLFQGKAGSDDAEDDEDEADDD